MTMRYHKVMVLSEDTYDPEDGTPPYKVPRVPGATGVSRQDSNRSKSLFIAYGAWRARGAGKGRTRDAIAYLHQYPGTNDYVMFADDESILAGGKSVKEYGRSSLRYCKCEGTDKEGNPVKFFAVLDTVPAKDASPAEPWTVNGMTVTKAVPSVPSNVGDLDMRGVIEKEPYKAVEVIS